MDLKKTLTLGGNCSFIEIFLIHHLDESRVSEVRKVSHTIQLQRNKVLCDTETTTCGDHLDVVMEIYDQSNKMELPSKGRYRLQGMLCAIVQRYTAISRLNKNKLKKILFFISQLTTMAHYRSTAVVSRLTELILIDKHIAVWTYLANSQDRGCVVLEDDCRFHPDRNYDSLYLDILKYSDDYDFIDLAGGFSFEALGLGTREVYISEDSVLANTTCAYYISRDLARIAIRKIQINPYLRYLGVGFVLNGIQSDKDKKIRSILFGNPWLSHGSFNGNVISSISENH